MINSKLINILRTFSKNELKEFEKFIGSPYYNKGRNYLPLLTQINKFSPKFEDETLTHEYVYSLLYPGKKFNKQIIWNMTSSLQQMAEEFLISTSLTKNKFIKNRLLADEFLNRRLASYQLKKLDEMEKAIEKTGISEDYFKNKNELESGRMMYHFLKDTQHLLSKHIVKKGEYAIMNMLRQLSSVINDINANAFMFNAKFDVNIPFSFISAIDMESVIRYARDNNYEDSDIMEMLYCSIMTVIKGKEEKYFLRLKELFELNIERFSDNEKLSWITTLSNYCTLRGNEGEKKYREYLFDLNNLELKVGYSGNSKHLSKILFIQILRNALSINKTEWAPDYINEYSQRLRSSYQKPMKALALAYLNLKLKKHSLVIENLKDVKFIDIRDKMYVKSLYLRTYFETREFELLMYQVDSAKHFISSTVSLSEKTRVNFLRFLNFLTNLTNAIEKNDSAEIEIIRKKLTVDPELPFGEWLLLKIEELKK
ncbi:MAG TPA: hypothetical protein PKE39_00280 [Ignavibacteria bacterium]|nr:hypothetical protein [Ignavibacteria bacterium]HMQ97431.1 hypothetical protein [Ignavibacteria bacterium]